MVMLDRKDSLKIAANNEDGAGGGGALAVRWEPFCEQVLERLLSHSTAALLLHDFPPRPGSSKKLIEVRGEG